MGVHCLALSLEMVYVLGLGAQQPKHPMKSSYFF